MKPVIYLLFFCASFPALSWAQQFDNSAKTKDTFINPFYPGRGVRADSATGLLLTENSLLNSTGKPVSMAAIDKKQHNNDTLFYMLTGVVLFLALLRFLFARYFTNLFRVFFNTSLRQSQLTDQLLQAKLPSLFFNLFFILSGGLYVYFLLSYYHLQNGHNRWLMMGGCVTLLGLIYFFKFCTLKFTGWVTGFKEQTGTHIFILFLINKIIGIFLVPFTILLAFSDNDIKRIAVFSSLAVIGFLLLMRFFRSYGLLQNQLKISRFHFFMYIIGIEILPLLLLYRGMMILLNKNL